MLCSWERHFSLTVSLSTREYEPSEKLDVMLDGYLQWINVPLGKRETH